MYSHTQYKKQLAHAKIKNKMHLINARKSTKASDSACIYIWVIQVIRYEQTVTHITSVYSVASTSIHRRRNRGDRGVGPPTFRTGITPPHPTFSDALVTCSCIAWCFSLASFHVHPDFKVLLFTSDFMLNVVTVSIFGSWKFLCCNIGKKYQNLLRIA